MLRQELAQGLARADRKRRADKEMIRGKFAELRDRLLLLEEEDALLLRQQQGQGERGEHDQGKNSSSAETQELRARVEELEKERGEMREVVQGAFSLPPLFSSFFPPLALLWWVR